MTQPHDTSTKSFCACVQAEFKRAPPSRTHEFAHRMCCSLAKRARQLSIVWAPSSRSQKQLAPICTRTLDRHAVWRTPAEDGGADPSLRPAKRASRSRVSFSTRSTAPGSQLATACWEHTVACCAHTLRNAQDVAAVSSATATLCTQRLSIHMLTYPMPGSVRNVTSS